MSDINPKISIVTISFNQASFIQNCINSVVSQNYQNIEYIIVDAGSDDGSREIISKNKKKLSHIIFESDLGPADGLNKGFSYATGDIYYYLNSDDELLPGALQTIVDVFRANPKVNIIIGNGFIVDKNKNLIKSFRSFKFNQLFFAYGQSIVMQQSTFFDKKSFLNAGKFNINNKTCWDAEFLIDSVINGSKIMNIDKYLSIFTYHDDSITFKNNQRNNLMIDKKRIFYKIMNREPLYYDHVLSKFFWCYRWLTDPKRLIIRIKESIFSYIKRQSL